MIRLRTVDMNDSELLFRWANDPAVREMSVNSAAISQEDHIKWFERKLKSDHTRMYILVDDSENIGLIRFEQAADEWVIGYSVSAAQRGKGYGEKIIRLGLAAIGQAKIAAYVKPANLASVKIFERVGFINTGITEENGIQLIKFTLDNK